MVGQVTHIIIIESLVDEKLTGKEIYDDCIKRRIDLYNKPMSHSYHSISNEDELIELIKYYQVRARYMSGGILFHLEMHGDKRLDGLILSSASLISWSELIELFRPINITTHNRLFITMATCYGRYLYKGIDLLKKSPYSGYISASMSVSSGEIVDKYSLLFEKLIDCGNIVQSYLDMEKTGSSFFYKDLEATFNDSYKSFYNKIIKDKNYKAKFLSDANMQAQQQGHTLTDEEAELCFEKALQDLHKKHREAFHFSNTE